MIDSPLLRGLVRHKLAVLLTLVVVVRVAVFLAFPGVFAWDQTGEIHGSSAYDTYARNLLATGEYGVVPGVPDANIPPAYSIALAGIYGWFGRTSLAVALWHTVLDVLMVYALYELGRRLFRGWGTGRAEAVAWLAGLFTAFYPYLVFQNLTLIDTPFFMALMYLWLLLMAVLRDRQRLNGRTVMIAVIAGVVLGIGTLTRPVLPPLAVLVAVWFLFRLPLKQTVLRLLPVAGVSLLILVLWAARSSAVLGGTVLMATNGGANFYQGNSPNTIPYLRAGYDVQWTSPDDPTMPEDPRLADQRMMQIGLTFLRENPGLIPELLWLKFLAHWSIDVFPYRNPVEGEVLIPGYDGTAQVTPEGDDFALGGLPAGDPVGAYSGTLFDQIGRPLHQVYFGGLLLLAVIGVVASARLWRDVSLIWFLQITMTVMYVLFHTSTRYRAPTDPALFLFSAAALVWLVARWQARRRPSPAVAAADAA